MSDQISAWPEGLQPKTQQEWNDIAKAWDNQANRNTVLSYLKGLKIAAMKYARLNDPNERIALITAEQNRLMPGSLEGGEKKAAAKTAAPKAAGTGTAATTTAGAGAAGGAAANAAVMAKLDAILAEAQSANAILKLLLLQNPDALQLAADEDTLNEIASKSLAELAAGNG